MSEQGSELKNIHYPRGIKGSFKLPEESRYESPKHDE
jgi:hypothetical protein